jgi:hypothetical protein
MGMAFTLKSFVKRLTAWLYYGFLNCLFLRKGNKKEYVKERRD